MFDLLSSKISDVFASLKKKAVITEADLDKTLREIRLVLLEADVALPVTKEFLNNVKIKAEGEKIYKSISPQQMIVKIIHDELINILEAGNDNSKLNTNGYPAVFMAVGLQGAGKTTTVAKTAYYLQHKLNKKVLLVSVDLQRAAAYEQLHNLAKQYNLDFFEHKLNDSVVNLAKQAKSYAKDNNYDVLIVDTAGRLSIDHQLMQELQLLKKEINPLEILLVIDSMIGQASIKVAEDFNEFLGLTGSIFTKIDGDARGGSALSIKYITKVPIKFMGIGEGVKDFEIFNANRIADRILQMGDVVTLVEKMEGLENDEEIKGLAKRLQSGIFTMDDLKKQMQQVQKLGGIGSMLGFIPGLSQIKNKIKESGINENIIKKQIALIDSMTKQERKNPNIINSSRKKRIANGAGAQVEAVNKLLKQFEQTAKMLKQFNRGGIKNLTGLTKLGKNLF
ncbi:signal recognition particle protein [Rickettsiales bacterium LUAb2]